jgi:DNA-binding IclR family transcriptional regulator
VEAPVTVPAAPDGAPAPPQENRSDASKVHSVLAALDLLDCFARDEELGVTEIARRLGIAKSTAHRLLSTLCARGIAEQVPETGHYRLGLHLYELGQLAQDRVPLRHAALPLLEEVRLATGLTVHLAIADGADVVFLERMQTLRGIPLLGDRRRRMPAHTTSAGKVLAAFDPRVAQACLDAGLVQMTPRSIHDPAAWKTTLERVRRDGFAVSVDENEDGLASIAAPVRDASGRARAAVSVAGPSATVLPTIDRTSRVVRLAASKLTRRLGW